MRLAGLREALRPPWTIRQRLVFLVLAIALPLLMLVVGVIVELGRASRTTQYTNLQFTTRAIVGAIEGQLSSRIALAETLAQSPALLDDDLAAFRRDAERAFPDLSRSWLIVSDLEGQQILNLLRPPGTPLPRRTVAGLAAQQRAFERRAPQVSGATLGPVRGNWAATVDVPIFREGKPFRSLAIVIDARVFFDLITRQQPPANWRVAIMDTQGIILARSPDNGQYVGKPAAPGWREIMDRSGIFSMASLEGDPVILATEPSALSGWAVGIGVPESELERPVRNTVLAAGALGAAVSLLSLLLAFRIGGQIAGPIHELEDKAQALVVGGGGATLATKVPEIARVWGVLRAAVAERRTSEDLRARQLGEIDSLYRTAPIGLALLDRDGRYLRLNQALADINGRPIEAQLGQVSWEIAPDLRAWSEPVLRQVIERGEVVVSERRGESPGNPGVLRDWIQKWYPVRDAAGQVVGAGLIVEDVTERAEAARRHTLLMDELTHRVKNTLAVVQAMALQTLRTTPEPEAFTEAFSARLASLARAHDLLTRGAWAGAGLADIVGAALEPFQVDGPESPGDRRVTMTGPPVELPAGATITLSLMLHELATNAAKYGALSMPAGRVGISWEIVTSKIAPSKIAGGRSLDLRWNEVGGPPVGQPARKGFGSRLLDMGATQLEGEIDLDYAAAGLRCRLRFPLDGA